MSAESQGIKSAREIVRVEKREREDHEYDQLRLGLHTITCLAFGD